MNVIPSDAPAADVVEVSLIGPGYDESVIVRLGDGQWIIVDFCFDENFQGFPRSAALTYLNRIKVDFAKNVSCILATHLHNDHISGLSEVVDFCRSAVFCYAAAFSRREFLGHCRNKDTCLCDAVSGTCGPSGRLTCTATPLRWRIFEVETVMQRIFHK